MTGPELKTIREGLGLSVPSLAKLANVQERTVRYWESGKNPVPTDVAALINKIDNEIQKTSDQALLHFIDSKTSTNNVKNVVLLRYKTDEDLWQYQESFTPLPATCHAAMLNRVRLGIIKNGGTVQIVFFEPEKYEIWRNKQGLADSAGTRAAWGTISIK